MPQLTAINRLVATAKNPIEATLLDNVTANTPGSWKYAGEDSPTLVTVEGVAGAFSATVEIHASTQPAPPADSDNSRVILWQTASLSQSFQVPAGYRWIKARVTGYASGTIFCGMVASG